MSEEDGIRTFYPVSSSGSRVYTNLNTKTGHGSLNMEIPLFGSEEKKVVLKTGTLIENQTRNFAAQRFKFMSTGGGTPRNDIAENIFTKESIGPERNQWKLNSVTFAEDHYDANDNLSAWYGMVNIPLFENLRIVTGARYEDSRMRVFSGTRNPDEFDGTIFLHNTDWFPSASINYSPIKEVDLRASISKTTARPEYRELVPYSFQDYILGRPKQGNPNLKTTFIDNYDISLEWHNSPGALISLRAFEKEFENPIELAVVSGSSRKQETWLNAKSAKSQGLEFEVRQPLSFVKTGLDVNANLTLLNGEVNVGDFNEKRGLMGQSPYLFNANLSYTSPAKKFESTLLYNTFGERITALDIVTNGPFYEQPRHNMDLTGKYKLGRFTLSGTVKNLLGSDYKVTQRQQDGRIETTDFHKIGRDYSLGISTSF